MGLPQIIYVLILFMGLGVSLAQHGQPKTGNNSFFASFIAVAIQLALLYWGGFFR